MQQSTKKILRITLTIFLAVVLISLTIWLMPWFLSLSDAQVREDLKNSIHSMGIGGVFFLLGIQILQIVIAILPGEPIELLSGMIYSTWGGLALCLAGILIGTTIVYFMVRALGRNFVERVFSPEKVQRFSFLKNSKKLETLIFLLFFIPGTPKDILTYIAPLTPIRPKSYFIIATFARIPSVITSTYAGQTIIDGEWWKTILMFVLMGAIGLAGIWINNMILEKHSKDNPDSPGKTQQ